MPNIAIPNNSLLFDRQRHAPDGTGSTQTGKLGSASSLRSAAAPFEAEEETPVKTEAVKQRPRRVRSCRKCNGKLVRVSRTSLLQHIISCFGVYTHVGEHCEARAFRSNYKQLVAGNLSQGRHLGISCYRTELRGFANRKVTNPWKSMESVVAFHFESASARRATAL
jgi:hypothetical protein